MEMELSKLEGEEHIGQNKWDRAMNFLGIELDADFRRLSELEADHISVKLQVDQLEAQRERSQSDKVALEDECARLQKALDNERYSSSMLREELEKRIMQLSHEPSLLEQVKVEFRQLLDNCQSLKIKVGEMRLRLRNRARSS
jgi:chromosome segregation ATPase